MPKLPTDNEIVSLHKSRFSNKNKIFTGGVVSELFDMPEERRINNMRFSLTRAQQLQYDKVFDILENFDVLLNRLVNSKHIITISKQCVLNTKTNTLYIKSEPYPLYHRLQLLGLLKALSSSDNGASYSYSYDEFLDENRDTLRGYDIYEYQQIKTAKHQLNRLFPDFFPEKGTLRINPALE